MKLTSKIFAFAITSSVAVVAAAMLVTQVHAATFFPITSSACLNINRRLANINSSFQKISTQREAAYNNTAARFQAEIQSAQDAGYNTAKMQADYLVLTNDIKAFDAARLALASDIVTTENDRCYYRTFPVNLQMARNQLVTVQKDDSKVRYDISSAIKPDLNAYINWLRQQGQT